MQKPSLDLELDLSEFFTDIVDETLHGRKEQPSPMVREYLVGLLEDSALSLGKGPIESALDGPLAVQLSHALHAPAAARFEKLRTLGDGILLLGGIYQPQLERSGLKDHYVSTLGSRAYASASSLIVPARGIAIMESVAVDVLANMAEAFPRLMALLRDVADTIMARAARSAGDLTRLCERWLRYRSAHLANLLAAKGIQVHNIVLC